LQKPLLLTRIEIILENSYDSTIYNLTTLEFDNKITGGHHRHYYLFRYTGSRVFPVIDGFHPCSPLHPVTAACTRFWDFLAGRVNILYLLIMIGLIGLLAWGCGPVQQIQSLINQVQNFLKTCQPMWQNLRQVQIGPFS
jgi:hypothetical protein